MMLDLNLPTVLAALVALKIRALEQQACGIDDGKYRRAYQELERCARESFGLNPESAAIFLRH